MKTWKKGLIDFIHGRKEKSHFWGEMGLVYENNIVSVWPYIIL